MTAFDLQTGKIVGKNSSSSWAQNHIFSPKKERKRLLFGNLFASLSIKPKKENLDLTSFGKEIISRLHEIYYSSKEAKTLVRLKLALKHLISEFADRVDLQITAGVVIEKHGEPVGYFALAGQGKAVILRNNQLAVLLEKADEEIKAVSGYLKDNDLCVLGTAQFFKLVSLEALKGSLETNNAASLSESLAPLIHGQESNSQTAAIIFKLKFKEQDKKEIKTELPAEEIRDGGKVEKISKKESLKNLFINLSFLAKSFKKQPNIFIRDKNRKTRAKKTTLSVGIILISLLLVSVFLGSKKKVIFKESQKAQDVFKDVEYKYEQAVSLGELNPLRARSLLTEAKKQIEEARGEAKGKEEERLNQLLSQVEKELEKVAKEYKLETADVFLDLALAKENFKGDNWGYSEEILQILDTKMGTILSVDVVNKTAKVTAGGEKLEGALRVGAAEDKVFVLKRDELLVVNKEEGEVVDTEKAEEWNKVIGVVGFGGNAYLLDTAEGEIWKHVRSGDGVAKARGYFQQGPFNLDEGMSMAIDGSIWVLFSDGTIVKFTRGVKDSFLVTGLDSGFQEPEKIYTNEKLDDLYILDRKNTRVVVINKETGEYQAQYVWSGIAGAKDIFASKEEKKILLLMGERIYEIGLR